MPLFDIRVQFHVTLIDNMFGSGGVFIGLELIILKSLKIQQRIIESQWLVDWKDSRVHCR